MKFTTNQLKQGLKILIDGESINDLELTNIRNQVGIILQDVFLFADTIFNNITLYNDKISLDDVQNVFTNADM